MNAAEKYFLPENYEENKVPTTMDEVSGNKYWTKKRLKASAQHQYSVYKYAGKMINENNIHSVIDVGCGPAMKLIELNKDCPAVEISGIDQQDPIDFCKSHHDFGKWYADDFENPRQDLEDLKAELVICADVIEHVVNPNKLLSYIRTRLGENGQLLISTPDRDRLYGQGQFKAGHPDHIREWTKQEFANYLESQNWIIEKHFYLPAIKSSMSRIFIRSYLNHFIKGRPQHMDYNQVILAKPA